MAGLSGISAYQQSGQSWKTGTDRAERSGAETKAAKTGEGRSVQNANPAKVEMKKWSPIDPASSLVPRKTEYGMTIGDVKLSDKASDYYNSLKSKFHNMDFIVVGKDQMAQVKANSAAYGNANKTVVLIDEEKLERMANDESFRKKYEGIITMAQTKLNDMKNSFASSGTGVKNFGINVDKDGNMSFFATLEKSQDRQKARIEKKAAEKRELKAKEKKKAEKQKQEERIEKAKEKRTEFSSEAENEEGIEGVDDKDYVTLSSNSLDDLMSRVSKYTYDMAEARVKTDAERMIGSRIDFRG